MGVLRFRRSSQLADSLRNYRLFVDGSLVGTIGPGAVVEVKVPPGSHEVIACIDWCSSNAVAVEVRPGDLWELQVGSNVRGWRIPFGWVYAFFLRSRYLYLHLAEQSAAADGGRDPGSS